MDCHVTLPLGKRVRASELLVFAKSSQMFQIGIMMRSSFQTEAPCL